MSSEPKLRMAEAAYPLLECFHAVDGSPVRSVWESREDRDITSIYAQTESGWLRIAVDADDDTIDLTLVPQATNGAIEVSKLAPWRSCIGKQFGWGWLGINQQGYLDSVFLSFGSDIPQLCITAQASALIISKLNRIASRSSVSTSRQAEPSPAVRRAA